MLGIHYNDYIFDPGSVFENQDPNLTYHLKILIFSPLNQNFYKIVTLIRCLFNSVVVSQIVLVDLLFPLNVDPDLDLDSGGKKGDPDSQH